MELLWRVIRTPAEARISHLGKIRRLNGGVFHEERVGERAMGYKPTVHIVDHDVETRTAIRIMVHEMGLVCEEYASGFGFLDNFDRHRPGCLVMEVRILDVSGPQIQRRLLAEGVRIPVIFLSGQASVPVVVRVMRDGAVYFLEKPWEEQQLWDAIQAAVRLDAKQRRDARRQREIKARLGRLKPAERDVLRMILEGRPNKEIARRQDVSIRTIETRRGNVMRKLGARNLAELLQIALAANGELRKDSEPRLDLVEALP